jgi:heat shock protein HtpX
MPRSGRSRSTSRPRRPGRPARRWPVADDAALAAAWEKVRARQRERREAFGRLAASANRRRALAALGLGALPGIVLALLGTLATAFLVAGLAVLAAWAVLAWWVYARAEASLARRLAFVEPSGLAGARLANLVEGLAATIGLPPPRLGVLRDPALNALALGGRPERGLLVVTSGLLDTLDRLELEGVVAHLLGRLQRRDPLPGTVAGTLLAPLWWAGAPVRALRARLAGLERCASADLLAVTLTRYPPGLLSALARCRAAATVRPALRRSVLEASAPLWLVPLDDPAAPGVDVTAPDPERPGELDLEERIAALAEW